jgi:quinone-modifying oxidoreductase, subunit QmoA
MSGQRAVTQTILVVGGGVAGISAAVEAAETGYDVVLLEKSPSLGGRVAQLNRYFPKLCHPACGLEINYQRLRNNNRIRVITMASISGVSGAPGAFTVKIETRPRYVNAHCTACGACAKASMTRVSNAFNYGMDAVTAAYLPHPMAYPMRYIVAPEVIDTAEADSIKAACKYGAIDLDEKPQSFELPVASIIWATGWTPYDAGKLESYGYGRIANVITNVEMERLAADGGPTAGRILRPSDRAEAKRVALIQCAGSRDLNHLPYCSRVCCLASLKHASYVRSQYPDSEVDIYYIDIRAHDKMESFYQKVKADPGVHFIKSKVASITEGEGGKPVLHGEDTLTRELYDRSYDLAVLAVGMEPAATGLPSSVKAAMDEYGFLAPPDDGGGACAAGQFAAGVASGPLDVSMSVQSATAAALKAIQTARGGEA